MSIWVNKFIEDNELGDDVIVKKLVFGDFVILIILLLMNFMFDVDKFVGNFDINNIVVSVLYKLKVVIVVDN